MQTHSLDEFTAEAVRFVSSLSPHETATVVALSGDLGAGKTTFTQAVAKHLGVEETVVSPTFVIQKSYPLEGHPPTGGFRRLIHIDAYRLKEERELSVLGWEELLTDPGNLILVEWPERVPGLLPRETHRVSLQYIDDNTREITLTGYGS